jgi:hypothetical protein
METSMNNPDRAVHMFTVEWELPPAMDGPEEAFGFELEAYELLPERPLESHSDAETRWSTSSRGTT